MRCSPSPWLPLVIKGSPHSDEGGHHSRLWWSYFRDTQTQISAGVLWQVEAVPPTQRGVITLKQKVNEQLHWQPADRRCLGCDEHKNRWTNWSFSDESVALGCILTLLLHLFNELPDLHLWHKTHLAKTPTPRAVTSCWVSAVTPQISCSHQTVFNLFIVFVQMTQKFAQLHFITFMPQIRILQTPSVLNELHHKTDGNIQVHMKLSASVIKTLYKQSK